MKVKSCKCNLIVGSAISTKFEITIIDIGSCFYVQMKCQVIASHYVYVPGVSNSHERRHHNGKKNANKTPAAQNTPIVESKRQIQRELAFINTIVAELLLQKNPADQQEIDQILRLDDDTIICGKQ